MERNGTSAAFSAQPKMMTKKSGKLTLTQKQISAWAPIRQSMTSRVPIRPRITCADCYRVLKEKERERIRRIRRIRRRKKKPREKWPGRISRHFWFLGLFRWEITSERLHMVSVKAIRFPHSISIGIFSVHLSGFFLQEHDMENS